MPEVTLENVTNKLKDVEHPEINATLLDLGILKEIRVDNGEIYLVLAFPFPNIYENVKQYLINAVTQPLAEFNTRIHVKLTVMDDKTRERFFNLEREKWRT